MRLWREALVRLMVYLLRLMRAYIRDAVHVDLLELGSIQFLHGVGKISGSLVLDVSRALLA